MRQFRRTVEMHPETPEFHDQIAEVYEQQNKFADAYAERQQTLRLSGNSPLAVSLEQVYQRSGYKGYLLATIQSLERTSKPASVPNLQLAHLYAIAGDGDHALHYLERDDELDAWLLNIQVDPAMDSLRFSPRFRDLVHRIGLPSP
jgi:tetratricopeptide (TPR) repeat protein